jgi:hypothetical protein
MSKRDDDFIKQWDRDMRLFHTIPPEQDETCPHINWMYEDAIHLPGIGEWKCRLQEYHHGEYGQNLDYKPCNHQDHKTCPVFLANQQKQG